MKTALGMIIRNLTSDDELMRFITNAEKNGHRLDAVIIAYTHRLDSHAAQKINERVPLYAININHPQYARDWFHTRDISAAATKTLLECPVDTRSGLVPYGFNRTIVTIEAILRGMDILFFVDNDVYPSSLELTPEGPVVRDLDFFGAHFEQLEAGSLITTGEYSGYNILPPASFSGMDDLLYGLQKSEMLDYWQDSAEHRCLTAQSPDRSPVPCTKILGGNTAITLSAFKHLPPFFSSYYTVDDELYLSRGEDTVLGVGIKNSGTECTDIGIFPLHDTYKNYPSVPDLRCDPSAQDRFFYACTGWIGRNPFLNYLLGNDLEAVRESQRERLGCGLRSLSEYTSNPRYIDAMRNFDISWDNIGRYVDDYEQVLEAWHEFIERSDLTLKY